MFQPSWRAIFSAISSGSRKTCSPRSFRRLMLDITIDARIAVAIGERMASGVKPSPSPGRISAVPETPITVTALTSAPRPRRAVSVGKGPPVRSAKQRVYLPGWPMDAMSPTSGSAPPMLRMTSCRARPMLALARLPGPRQLVPALTPSVRAIGPWTQRATQAVPVVVAIPSKLKSASSVAWAAASTTASSAGRQPAITH